MNSGCFARTWRLKAREYAEIASLVSKNGWSAFGIDCPHAEQIASEIELSGSEPTISSGYRVDVSIPDCGRCQVFRS
jgi:hypothetical protein